MIRHPLPSPGSLGSVPRARRYYGMLRLPADPDALPFVHAVGAHRRALLVFIHGRGRSPAVRSFLSSGSPIPRSLGEKRQDLSGSLGGLVCVPRSTTPAERNGLAMSVRSVRLSGPSRPSASAIIDISALNSRPTDSLSTLHATSCLVPRKTRFRSVANLCRVGSKSHGPPAYGFRTGDFDSHGTSSIPGLVLTH